MQGELYMLELHRLELELYRLELELYMFELELYRLELYSVQVGGQTEVWSPFIWPVGGLKTNGQTRALGIGRLFFPSKIFLLLK